MSGVRGTPGGAASIVGYALRARCRSKDIESPDVRSTYLEGWMASTHIAIEVNIGRPAWGAMFFRESALGHVLVVFCLLLAWPPQHAVPAARTQHMRHVQHVLHVLRARPPVF